MTPQAIAGLISRRDLLAEERRRRDDEHRTACDEEAEAATIHEKAFAIAFLEADGPVKEREMKAKLTTEESLSRLNTAIALRRSASASLRALEADFNCISAALHAVNRALRMEHDALTGGMTT